MNEFIVFHTGGEFLVRTTLDATEAANRIAEKWKLDIEAIDPATAEDIAINLNQWTELDLDA
ncbi:hypothetical protein [Actinoplanes sp. G11-F43]|uniref:hypothetical protein n=1 Tax=Actinoplanes sp. G11-F43 TaxID=3424130 RepID=UPI003D358C00